MRFNEIAKSSPALDTRRLYSFEANYFYGTPATKSMSMNDLRIMAEKIWERYGKKKPMPRIVAGRGTQHGDMLYSFSQEMEDGNYIQLSRNQRNKLVLVHELIHAMGYDYHDSSFVKIYLKILSEVLSLPLAELRKAAKEYKLNV